MKKDRITVLDSPETVHDRETARKFDEAFRVSENRAKNKKIREHVERVVMAALGETEGKLESRRRRWIKLRRLFGQESLSEKADSYDIHLGGPFRICEEYAGKMEQSIFGVHGFLSAEVDDAANSDRGEAAVALVVEQMLTEGRLKQKALEWLRNAAIYGENIVKIVPKRVYEEKWSRDVSSYETEEGTLYSFGKPEKKELAPLCIPMETVHPVDFRTPETADGIGKRWWAGDYSYPTRQEVLDLAEQGVYDKAVVKELLERIDHRPDSKEGGDIRSMSRTDMSKHRFTAERSADLMGSSPDSGPQVTHLARFDWWGRMKMPKDDRERPWHVVVLMPADDFRPIFRDRWRGSAVLVEENPYWHGEPPYAYHPVIKLDGEFYSQSVMEIAGKHSSYEDEAAANALVTSRLEANPPLEVAEAAGVTEQDLDNWLYGKPVFTETAGNIQFINTPAKTGIPIQVMEWYEGKAERTIGLGEPAAAPRMPSSGVLTGAQEKDSRLVTYLRSWEEHFISRASKLYHSYNQQFMTKERKVKILGKRGLDAPDIRTVRPEDVMVDVRFEPITTRQLTQKAFQGQQLINFLDRGIQLNMMGQATGQGEFVDIRVLLRQIVASQFGMTDPAIIKEKPDPSRLLAAAVEHNLFAMGERLDIQEGENVLVHARAHTEFILQGGLFSRMQPEDQQALVDHTWKTWERVLSQYEQAMPGIKEIVEASLGGLEQQGLVSSKGGSPAGPQPGGRGMTASATQDQGSPLFRRETPGSMMQSIMGSAGGANGGAF